MVFLNGASHGHRSPVLLRLSWAKGFLGMEIYFSLIILPLWFQQRAPYSIFRLTYLFSLPGCNTRFQYHAD